MKRLIFPVAALLLAACATAPPAPTSPPPAAEWTLAIHGGAGTIERDSITPEQDAAYRAALEAALDAGSAVLSEGGSALDAVEAATASMERDALFNAGVGAVMTAEGTHELDASIMDGRSRDAGAVAGVTSVASPIAAARAVMERSEHVMFAGAGADAFARAQGLEQVRNGHFTTERRAASLQRVLDQRRRTAEERSGTVGAVARDRSGTLAAATSTGGMTAKSVGRVGDSPLIGAATYAQNAVCAVSATGHGEYFIRVGVAKTICARMELAAESADVAAADALAQVAALGGDGGVIVLDGSGAPAFVFNTEGMYRGVADASGERRTAIYGDETP